MLAIVRMPEKQVALKSAIPGLITEINIMHTIFNCDDELTVHFHLGGDLYF